jgi:hypothetical protein
LNKRIIGILQRAFEVGPTSSFSRRLVFARKCIHTAAALHPSSEGAPLVFTESVIQLTKSKIFGAEGCGAAVLTLLCNGHILKIEDVEVNTLSRKDSGRLAAGASSEPFLQPTVV